MYLCSYTRIHTCTKRHVSFIPVLRKNPPCVHGFLMKVGISGSFLNEGDGTPLPNILYEIHTGVRNTRRRPFLRLQGAPFGVSHRYRCLANFWVCLS